MIALVLLGCLALSSAAPHYPHHRHHHRGPHSEHPHGSYSEHPYGSPYDSSLESYWEREMFNTRRFWDELSREMSALDAMLADFGRRFPSSVSSEKIEGNEYIITIPLPSYEEKEIVVKARKGLLLVQAVHKTEGEQQQSNYLDVRTLPDSVNEAGHWSFENGVLKIVFPIRKDGAEGEIVTDVPATEAPEHSREEMEPTVDDNANQNADVESDRGDLGNNRDLFTNEIPKHTLVEATTYAVDLKNEVELVPAQY